MSETLADLDKLCKQYGTRGYYTDGEGLVAVQHKRMFLWFRWNKTEYKQSGSTRTAQGARYRRILPLDK